MPRAGAGMICDVGADGYVALLRAVNVGGRTVAMDDLRRLFRDLGLDDVRTYIQSGNVAFRSPRPVGELAPLVDEALAGRFGAGTIAVLRTGPELAGVLAANPFADRTSDPRSVHVMFLAREPGPDALDSLRDSPAAPSESFAVAGRHVYLHCPDGYGRTKLTNAFFERRLDTPATTRNWRTVAKLADMAGG